MKEYLTYEEFGAKGDGIADDFDAIIACHEEANKTGLSVKANDNASYYIGPSKESAIIKTTVDFGTAKIIIDDRNVENKRSYVFKIVSDYETFDPEIKSLKKGQKHIDIPHEGNLYVKVYNENTKIYIREGLNMNDGTATTDCFEVDAEGNISPSVDWDYPTVTSAFAIRTDDKPITVKGGIFTTIANQAPSFYTYYKRGILVNRSHVTITDVKHYVEGELDHGAPYHGFYFVYGCVDITIQNALLTPRLIYFTASKIPGKDVMMGSYDLSLDSAIGVKCKNITQAIDYLDKRYWGIYTSNFCKNLSLDNCTLSRFDAHQGVTNVTIRNCRIGHQHIKLIGFGEAVIENTSVCGSRFFIELRGDYGSLWDGNLTVKNCSYSPSVPCCHILNPWNLGNHDFGYVCYMPHNIEIDGFTIYDDLSNDKGELDVAVLGNYTNDYSPDKPYAYVPAEKITIKDFSLKGNGKYTVVRNAESYSKTIIEEL